MRLCPHSVGSVISRQDGIDPNSLWASTTWTEVGQGRFPIGADSTHANGSTGDPTHTHNLSSNGHALLSTRSSSAHFQYSQTPLWKANYRFTANNTSTSSESSLPDGINLEGKTDTASCEPAWFGVRFWKRVA